MPRVWVRPNGSKLVIAVLVGVVVLGACDASSNPRSSPPAPRPTTTVAATTTTLPAATTTLPAATTTVSEAPTAQPVVPLTTPPKEMHWSPKSGPRGSVVTLSGTPCDHSTVYLSLYGPRGDPAGAAATAAVKPDGTWTGEIVVPQNAQVGHDYGFQATCGEKFTPEEYYDPLVLFHVVP